MQKSGRVINGGGKGTGRPLLVRQLGGVPRHLRRPWFIFIGKHNRPRMRGFSFKNVWNSTSITHPTAFSVPSLIGWLIWEWLPWLNFWNLQYQLLFQYNGQKFISVPFFCPFSHSSSGHGQFFPWLFYGSSSYVSLDASTFEITSKRVTLSMSVDERLLVGPSVSCRPSQLQIWAGFLVCWWGCFLRTKWFLWNSCFSHEAVRFESSGRPRHIQLSMMTYFHHVTGRFEEEYQFLLIGNRICGWLADCI